MGIRLPENNKIVIKKYSNRRLYNTEISSYITLEELSDLIKKDRNIIVIDAKTGEDLTRLTLTQIILDHEMKGYSLLPLEFLKQIIKLYDNEISKTFSAYLTHVMQYFLNHQNQIQEYLDSFGDNNMMFSNQWTKIWEQYTQQSTDLMKNFFDNITQSHHNNPNKDKNNQ